VPCIFRTAGSFDVPRGPFRDALTVDLAAVWVVAAFFARFFGMDEFLRI
jgi:hypothetical protein